MANRYLAAKVLAQSRQQARVPTGITCGKGMTKGALQPFSQSLGSHPCAFFSLLVDGCCFRAFPSLNQWAGCQPWSCASTQPCEAARHGDGARGHRALLAAFGGDNPNFPFFSPSSGNSCKRWKIITLWNRFDFLPGLLSLPDTLKTWGFWRENFITHDWSFSSPRVDSTLECLYRLGGAAECKYFSFSSSVFAKHLGLDRMLCCHLELHRLTLGRPFVPVPPCRLNSNPVRTLITWWSISPSLKPRLCCCTQQDLWPGG